MTRARVFVGAAMLLVWLALWGSVSPLTVVGGILVVLLAGHVLVDLTRSSVELAWLTVRPAPPPPTAIIAVQLRDKTDAVIVTVSQLLTLVPGTLTVDMDVPSGTLYLHIPLTTDLDEAAAGAHAQVHLLEDRVVRAVGPRRDDPDESDRTAGAEGEEAV